MNKYRNHTNFMPHLSKIIMFNKTSGIATDNVIPFYKYVTQLVYFYGTQLI